MIKTIATYIADNTNEDSDVNFVTGENLWLHNLPEGDYEGAVVKLVRHVVSFGDFPTYFISIPVAYKDWSTQQDALDIIQDLVLKWGRVNVDWGISGELEITSFGIDEYGRYVSAILITVK